jgi:AraC family transcriptional regulator, L-rhamnose operon regulatory protein RhaS
MKTFSLYQEFDISVHENDQWEFGTHKHSFFELVFILEGSGTHILNDNRYAYSKGSLFLLTPEDYHSFEIKDRTTFCIIAFNKIYFSKERTQDKLTDFSDFFKLLEIVFYNANYLQNEPIRKEEDKFLATILIKNLIWELREKSFFYNAIIQNSVFLLLTIIARNIQEHLGKDLKKANPKSEIADILAYVQQNIYRKDKLKSDVIAAHFCKSKNYISEYFKVQTGEGLKDYILKHRVNLAKIRLAHSNLTILQICDELGFADESHLNKTFKQFTGQTTKQFRTEHEESNGLLGDKTIK